MFVKAPRGVSNEDYVNMMDRDFDVLQPLHDAHGLVESALIALEDSGLDSEAQREYARTQIESMRYLLGRILTEHLEA